MSEGEMDIHKPQPKPGAFTLRASI